jgi:hypothetical protein
MTTAEPPITEPPTSARRVRSGDTGGGLALAVAVAVGVGIIGLSFYFIILVAPFYETGTVGAVGVLFAGYGIVAGGVGSASHLYNRRLTRKQDMR